MSPNLISVGVFAYPLWDLSYLGCEKYTVNNFFFFLFFLNLKLTTTVDENLIRKGEKKKTIGGALLFQNISGIFSGLFLQFFFIFFL